MAIPGRVTTASSTIRFRKKRGCLYTDIFEEVNVGSGIPAIPDKGKRFSLPLWTNLSYQKAEPYIITTLWGFVLRQMYFQHKEIRMMLSESFSQLDHVWIMLSIVIFKYSPPLPAPIPPPPAARDMSVQTKCKQITSCFGFVHSSAFTSKTDKKHNC